VDDIITKYNKEYNGLIEMVVQDFEKYMAEIQKSLERLKAKNVKIENPGSYVMLKNNRVILLTSLNFIDFRGQI
jgi:hypothetical protein